MTEIADTPLHNRLDESSSPYLRQHADNPVAWQPWDEAALEAARTRDLPILLSIGYSACHWCHVMAHESFEDPATAEVMNRLFVNIKVDREERPDLDKVYQLAHQMLTQRGGGWPLTVFLDPQDLVPFFAGTYFPREARYGMPAFADLLARAEQHFRSQREAIRGQARALGEVFGDLVPPGSTGPLDRSPLAAARAAFEASFDGEWGGFGGAPKFPHAAGLERLLRDWHATAATPEPDLRALYMSTLTQKRMIEGGLFDQLGGGFCRYSVDPYWMIPHFEKMLYDNAALLALTAQTAIATGDGLYRRAAMETAGWAIREMQSPEGGFYAALDADSEGHEGRFYAWDRDMVRRLLPADEYAVLAARFGLEREPNFEGRWHLHSFEDLEAIAARLDITPAEAAARLDAGRQRLFEARETRIRPARDDKILTAWNALMIRGLAISARLLGEAAHGEAATQALECLRQRCLGGDGLLAAAPAGSAPIPAYLDDHAFLLDALLELLQLRWRSGDFALACQLADALLAKFSDAGRGGFWFTAEGQDPPLCRPKGFADEATPSGNGVAALALARLGWLSGETRYLEAAEQALRGGWASLQRAPQAHATLLNALEEHLAPGEIVIIRGEAGEATRWAEALAPWFAPKRQVFAIPADAADLPAALAAKAPREATVAYICRGPVCSAPAEDLQRLVRALRDGLDGLAGDSSA